MKDEWTIRRIAPLSGPFVSPDDSEWPVRIEIITREEYERHFPVRDNSGRPIAPPQAELPPRPDGPHLSNADARRPVQS